MALRQAFLICLCSTALELVHALNNGLARTPPMGWNPYNAFLSVLLQFDCAYNKPKTISTIRCDTAETQYKSAAQSLIDLGLRDLGYEYLNL